MKILITGGRGFIARSLSEALSGEHVVEACDRKALDLLDSNAVFEYIRQGRFDQVIHAATYDAAPIFSRKDPAKVLEYNLKMFFNVARCQNFFGKMIYFGTGAEFGREHWQPKMKEDYFDQHVPSDSYGFSKYVMTKAIRENKKIVNLRLFGVFGEHDDWRYRFIPSTCCRALFDLPITINQNRFFDYLYIDDLVKIVKWFIQHDSKEQVYNVCSGFTYELKALARMVLNSAGKKLDMAVKAEGMGAEYSGDNSLLMNELNGFKFCSMDEAIKKLYGWYELNKPIIDKDQLVV